MKKYIFVLFCVLASGCVHEKYDECDYMKQTFKAKEKAYANRDLTQEKIADELMQIRIILERASERNKP